MDEQLTDSFGSQTKEQAERTMRENLSNSGYNFDDTGAIAVDSLSRPADKRVDREVEIVNEANKATTSPALDSDINNAESTPPPEPTPEETVSEADRLAQEIQGDVDTMASERTRIREEQQTAEKLKIQNQEFNRLTKLREDKRRRIEEIQKQSGLTKAQKDAMVAQEGRVIDRRIADQSFTYNVALGDYQAAEQIATDYVDDLQQDLTNKQNTWTMLYEMEQNDMTESEKLQAQQAFQEKQMQDQFELDKKKLDYQSQIDRANLEYKASLEGEGTFSVAERKTLFEMAEKGDTWAIDAIGYDPRQLPEAQKENHKVMEDAFFKTEQGIDAVNDILDKTSSLSGVTTSTDGWLGAISRTASAILPTGDIRLKTDEDGNKVLDLDSGGFAGQSDILSDLKYITANLTIDELGKMEVPLTPLSDADMRKVGEAASRLNGMLITKGEDQQIVGIRGSESKVREELDTINTSLQRVQDEINAKMLSADELTYIYQ